MIDNAFRGILPRFARPLTRLYAKLNLTPNGVSVIAFALGCLAALCVAQGWALAAVALWWVGRLADGTDGIYARETGQASSFGAYFDIVLDMAAYGIMIVGFAFLHPELQTNWLLIQFLYVLCIASALALGMQEAALDLQPRDDRGLRLGAGLAEGGETGIAYTAFLFFPQHVEALSQFWILVLSITVIARTLLARRQLAS
ncbi:MAG: CDP-alcohol phosphatidyltransferase family protein [bacterium]|nr:CDP-alcohol phosphatidyltransferase family protein [bacterium]